MSVFDEVDPAVLHGIIRGHPLATLVTASGDGLAAYHVPFVLHADVGEKGTLRGHVSRANPLARGGDATALAIFQAADAYVTPSWYPGKAEHGRVVPTWNYVVAHAHGTLRLIDDPAWILAQMESLTRQQEEPRRNPWQVRDAPAEYIDKLVGAVIGIEIPIARLAGKRKVSQNRDARDRAGVAAGLAGEESVGALAMRRWVAPPG